MLPSSDSDRAADAARILRGDCCDKCAHRFLVQDYEGDENYQRPIYWLSCQREGIDLGSEVDPEGCCKHFRKGSEMRTRGGPPAASLPRRSR